MFVLGEATDDSEIPPLHPELFADVLIGDLLLVDDGRLRFELVAKSAERIEAITLVGGILRDRKGVNVSARSRRIGSLIKERPLNGRL